MAFSTIDLKSIAASGANMILNAQELSTSELEDIAASAKNSQIIIKNVRDKAPLELEEIVASGKGCIVFDFSKMLNS